MKIVDIVKWEMRPEELVHKYESDSLRLGSQLIVYPGQTAFFVKGGILADEFQAGTYTIKSENIPILEKLVNVPFDNENPFKAEVWFVNQTNILDCKWGTSNNINIEDPKYKIIVPVIAYGQYGFKITSPRVFLESFVGNMPSFATEKLRDYFRGLIVSKLTNIISDKLLHDDVSVINISSYIEELSVYSEQMLRSHFAQYGISLNNFTIMSISVREDDESFIRLKEAKDIAAKIAVVGEKNYKMERSFNVLDKAAENGSGVLGSSIELGAGVAVGSQFGHLTTENFNVHPTNIPLVPNTRYYLAINGKQEGPYWQVQVQEMLLQGSISSETLIWKENMLDWGPISSLAEFNTNAYKTPPPIPGV